MNFRIKSKKTWLIIGTAAGIIMIIFSMVVPNGKDTDESFEYYSVELETRIRELISHIAGVDDVSVMITLDCGSEYVYAQNSDASDGRVISDYVVISADGGDAPVQLKEIYPRVRGVAVVCSGGDTVAVKTKITELLTASLGISSNRITVCG